jgi:hypothetical protein
MVKSRLLNGSRDIVAILGNGSFACTDPTFANYGLPCERIMALFLTGNAYINVGLHYNREYVVPYVNTMDRTDLIQLGVTVDSATGIDLIPVAADAAFDYAVKVTEFAWSLVGHGGERFDPILHPPPHAFKASKDTVAETLRRELQWIQPLLANNVKTRAEFYEFTNRWRGTLAEEGRNKAEAMTKATGGSTTAPTHIAARLIVDKSNKRKVSGDSSKNLVHNCMSIVTFEVKKNIAEHLKFVNKNKSKVR